MVTEILTDMATTGAAGYAYRKSNIQQYLPSVNKNYVWGAVLIGAVVVAIYYYGKKNATINPAPLPNDTQPKNDPATGQTTNPLTDAESKEITKLANKLHTELGYVTDADSDLLNEYLGTSDRVFVGTYNYYNSIYATAPETLKTKINSCSNWKFFWTEQNHQLDAIVARMDTLGLV